MENMFNEACLTLKVPIKTVLVRILTDGKNATFCGEITNDFKDAGLNKFLADMLADLLDGDHDTIPIIDGYTDDNSPCFIHKVIGNYSRKELFNYSKLSTEIKLDCDKEAILSIVRMLQYGYFSANYFLNCKLNNSNRPVYESNVLKGDPKEESHIWLSYTKF